MTINILGIGDMANTVLALKQSLKKLNIHIVDFPNYSLGNLFEEDKEFFKTTNLRQNLKKINLIKNQYDLFIVTGWPAATIAYLAGLNFIFYFLGTDIREPPFEKNIQTYHDRDRLNKYSFLDRFLYRKIFESSVANVTSFEEKFSNLKKYDSKAYRIDRVYFDRELFSEKISPTNKVTKKKFTFFSPSRIDKDKGFDILWKALMLCKSDFEIIQVKWFRPHEAAKKDKEMFIKTKPNQVQFIPLIERKDLGSYYALSDAVIGSFGVDYPENVAIEGVLCKKPVVSYSNPKTKFQFGNDLFVSPFLPKTKDPKDLASVIDNIVMSKDFRDDLVEKEFRFIDNETQPKKVEEDWNEFFLNIYKKCQSRGRESKTKIILRKTLLYSVKILSKIERHFKK